jgi:hypothetical protein
MGGLLAMVFVGLGLLLVAIRRYRTDHRLPLPLIGKGALVFAVFSAVSGWWFIRNWALYGDFTGMSAMLSVYGGRGGWPLHLVVPELIDTFRSYWAVFACGLHFPPGVYWLFAGLVTLAVVGWIRGWRRTEADDRSLAILLLVWFGIVFVMWVRWNQITFAPLGRLLFQANAAIGPLLGYGLVVLTGRPRWVAIGVGISLAALAVVGALAIVAPAYALPARYDVASAPVPDRPLPDALFGDEIEVLGYSLSSESLEPGEALDVALHLRALRPLDEDYVLSLQLVSAAPGEDDVLVNYNTFPGSGAYGTPVWQEGEVIIDEYRLQIPETVERAQAWRATAIFYRPQDGVRLPVTVAGQPSGDTLGLELVRVGGSQSSAPPVSGRMDPPPAFGDAILLRGAEVSDLGEPPGEPRVIVTLWWEAIGEPEMDYTVFVHLLDGQGNLAGSGDGPPMDGAYPTSVWQAGDHVVDGHAVTTEGRLLPGTYLVEVGWYDPDSGQRLPVSVGGKPHPSGAVQAGTLTVP